MPISSSSPTPSTTSAPSSALGKPPQHRERVYFILAAAILLIGGYLLYEWVYWSPQWAFERAQTSISRLKAYELDQSSITSNADNKYTTTQSGPIKNSSTAYHPVVELLRAAGPEPQGSSIPRSYSLLFNSSQQSPASTFREQGELRLVDQTYFIKFGVFPSLGVDSSFGSFKDKWYKRSADCILTSSQADTLAKFVKQQKFVSEAERVKIKPGEFNVKGRKYRAKVNKTAVLAVFDKENELGTGDCKRSSDEQSKLEQAYRESIGNVTAELFIAGDQYNLNLSFDQSVGGKNYQVTLNSNYTRFNKDVKLESPGGAETIPDELGFLAAVVFGNPTSLDFTLSNPINGQPKNTDGANGGPAVTPPR